VPLKNAVIRVCRGDGCVFCDEIYTRGLEQCGVPQLAIDPRGNCCIQTIIRTPAKHAAAARANLLRSGFSGYNTAPSTSRRFVCLPVTDRRLHYVFY
jgi:hypothetical protein